MERLRDDCDEKKKLLTLTRLDDDDEAIYIYAEDLTQF